MSFTYKMVESTCYCINRLSGNGIKKYMLAGFEKTDEREDIPKAMYRKFKVQKIEHKEFPVFILCKRNHKKENKKAILFLAGGGGMSRPMWIHFDTISRLIQKTDAVVYFAYYPLAPKYNVQKALVWLESVYKAMRMRYLPANITFMGDSAGVNLAFSLAYRSKVRPSKIIAISPAVGLEDGRNRDIRKEMETIDPILNVAMNDLIAKNWAKNVPLNSSDISPEYIDYSNFPEILMFYGAHELFYPHVKGLVEKMRRQGVVLETIEEPMCHDWALCSFFSEGQRAINKMRDFILK